ncbi:hypothetical protein ANTQUA_LOCUS10492 [Anthophora quadrimaculata]
MPAHADDEVWTDSSAISSSDSVTVVKTDKSLTVKLNNGCDNVAFKRHPLHVSIKITTTKRSDGPPSVTIPKVRKNIDATAFDRRSFSIVSNDRRTQREYLKSRIFDVRIKYRTKLFSKISEEQATVKNEMYEEIEGLLYGSGIVD